MMYSSHDMELRAAMSAAERVCAAARTAPKACGIDHLVTLTLTDADKDAVASKMEQISAEAKLLVRENISTEQELEVYKKRVQERMQSRLDERKVLQNLNRRVGAVDSEIEKRKEEIGKINEELKGLRKELRLCRGIESRSKTMEEKIEQEEQEQLKELRKERNLR